MKKISPFCALALVGAFVLVPNSHAQYANAVLSYNPGTGFAKGFTNSSVALGAPASGNSVTPFTPPSSSSQIVSIGAGGEITLQLSTPVTHDNSHPYGLDLGIFANQFFSTSSGIVTNLFYHAASITIEVSQDDSTWYTLNPSLAPQAGELYPTYGNGNPQIPVSPALTLSSFIGQNLAGVESLYGGSAGGTAYDLAWAEDSNGNPVSLSNVQYVQIDVASGVLDLDAVTVVPESSTTALLLLAGIGLLTWHQLRRTSKHRKKSNAHI